MRQAKALTVFDLVAECVVLLVEIKEGIHVALIRIREMLADVAGVLLLLHPASKGGSVFIALRAHELILEGGFAGSKVSRLFPKLAEDLFVVRLQDPGVSKRIAIVKHFLKMIAAKAGVIRHFADVCLHVGSAASQNKVDEVLFHGPLDKAKRAFILCIHGVI